MTSKSKNDVVVCDNGTGYVKVGFAGTNFPESVFPSMVGRPQLRAEMESLEGTELKDIMIGDEAEAVRFALEINYPVVCLIFFYFVLFSYICVCLSSLIYACKY